MGTSTAITVKDAIDHIDDLIENCRDEDALAYWAAVAPVIYEQLTADELFHVLSLLSSADRVVELERIHAQQEGAQESHDR